MSPVNRVLRVGVFGAPVARPLDFAEIALELDPSARTLEAEEHAAWRAFVVEATIDGVALRLLACVAPRHGVAAAFGEALRECDAAILLACVAGADEQAPALEGFAAAHAAHPRVPVVVVANEFVPPRLASPPDGPGSAPGPAEAAAATLRGRLCWWRHEKAGADLVRRALRALDGACGPA